MKTESKRRALVCASSGGLGWASAKRLLMDGRSVVLCSRDAGRLAAARERLLREVEDASPGDVETIPADLTRADDIERLWAETVAGGPVDILVTNAGGPAPGGLEDLGDAAWHGALDSLVLSVVRLMRLALPPMRERGWGRIVTITSVSAKEPIPGLLLSNVLRAGVAALVSTVAREEASRGVTVNNVCPGMTDTERLGELFAARAAKSGLSAGEERARSVAALPRGELNAPEEFGAVVAFLASEAASGVSGVSLSVDAAASHGLF